MLVRYLLTALIGISSACIDGTRTPPRPRLGIEERIDSSQDVSGNSDYDAGGPQDEGNAQSDTKASYDAQRPKLDGGIQADAEADYDAGRLRRDSNVRSDANVDYDAVRLRRDGDALSDAQRDMQDSDARSNPDGAVNSNLFCYYLDEGGNQMPAGTSLMFDITFRPDYQGILSNEGRRDNYCVERVFYGYLCGEWPDYDSGPGLELSTDMVGWPCRQ